MTQTFAILAGLPGSGKSTLAKQLRAKRGFVVVSTDGLRLALNAEAYPRKAKGEYKAMEPVVWELAQLAVKRFLKNGQNVAIDATFLTRVQRSNFIKMARKIVPGVRVEIHWCEGRYDSWERWKTSRGHSLKEYKEIRKNLEARVEKPVGDKADGVVVIIHPHRSRVAGTEDR